MIANETKTSVLQCLHVRLPRKALSIAFFETMPRQYDVIHQLPFLCEQLCLATLVDHLKFIRDYKVTLMQRDQIRYGWVGAEGLTDIVHALPAVGVASVRNEGDLAEISFAGRHVDQFAARQSKHRVKLGLDQHARPFPDRPAHHYLAAQHETNAPYVGKALVGPRARGVLHRYVNRLCVGYHLSAEGKHMRLADMR